MSSNHYYINNINNENNNNNIENNNNNIENNNNNENYSSADVSGNMYSYQDDSPHIVPNASNAIIRNIIDPINPNLNPYMNKNISPNIAPKINPVDNNINKISKNAQISYIDQFPETNQIRSPKNQNLQEYPVYPDNRSSEQRFPKNQEYNVQVKPYVPEQIQNQPPKIHPQQRKPHKFYLIIYIIIIIYHILMILLLGCCFKFKEDIEDYLYNFFKDIHLMIFIGFGMLYTILKDHQWSSLALVLFMGVISIEFSFFCYYLWYNSFEKKDWNKIEIDFSILSCIDFNSATVLISLGFLIGKLTIIQYFFVTIFETFFASLNYFICHYVVEAIDNGGSIYIHTFGSIFGILVSIILFCRESEFYKISNSPHTNSDYYSNIFSFIGCLFLWIFFPSFNIANIQHFSNEKINEDILRYRGIINTYLSISGSLISTFIISPLLFKEKLKMKYILNASYVGGIIIGGCCTICSSAWGAMIIGIIGGTICNLSLYYLKPKLRSCKTEDTLDILHIFGIPGILGGFLTCIFIGNFSNKLVYDDEVEIDDILGNNGRTISLQVWMQIGSILITIAIAASSGIVTGFVMNIVICQENEIYFVDSELFIEDENIPLPEGKYPIQNNINLSSSGNKLDDQEREVNIEQV